MFETWLLGAHRFAGPKRAFSLSSPRPKCYTNACCRNTQPHSLDPPQNKDIVVTGESMGTPPGPVAAINALVPAYLDAIDSLGSEPIASVRGLFVFYFRLIAWEIGMMLLLPIALVNVFIRFLGWCTGKKLRTLQNFGLQYSFDALKALHSGEVPLLQLVTFRSITRRFLISHIRRRLDNAAALLEQEEAFSAFLQLDENRNTGYSSIRVKLLRLRKILRRTGRFRLIVLLSPLVGFVSKFVGIDVPKFLYSRITSDWQWNFHRFALQPFADGRIDHDQYRRWLIYNLLTQVLVGVGITIFSSFIRKRQLLLARNIFQLEEAVFKIRPLLRAREAPLELVGYAVLIPLFFGSYYTALETPRGASLDPRHVIIVESIVFFSLPLLYALYRRIRMGQL
jgi:hypothetical protein